MTIQSQPGSSFPLTVTRRVDPLGDERCRVTETVEGEPGGFYRVAGPVLRAMVSCNIRRDYASLEALFERREGWAGGAGRASAPDWPATPHDPRPS